jgi:hypothetical protein
MDAVSRSHVGVNAMISRELLRELSQILKDEYNLELTEPELAQFGDFLLCYFRTLTDIESKIRPKHQG